MGSILYLALGVLFGYAVCETLFPNLKECGSKTFDGKALSLSSYLIRIPAWVMAGLDLGDLSDCLCIEDGGRT